MKSCIIITAKTRNIVKWPPGATSFHRSGMQGSTQILKSPVRYTYIPRSVLGKHSRNFKLGVVTYYYVNQVANSAYAPTLLGSVLFLHVQIIVN